MEILKKIPHITLAVVLTTSLSFAGWKTVADSQVSVQSANPSNLRTSITNSFSTGGIRMQWRNLGTVQLIHAEVPKFSVGCNGVEIGFGSISFLDFDELVNKLKLIASQAPAFAFKMAIDTACSQCSTIMQDIEEIVEAINNFSLDSCGIAQNIGNTVGAALTGTSGTRYSDNYESQKAQGLDRWGFNTDEVTDMINSWSDTINGKSLKLQKVKGYGSFLNNLRIKKFPALNEYQPKDYIGILRSIVGDVTGYMDEKNNLEDTYVYTAPVHDINYLISLLVGEKLGKFKKTVVNLHGNNGEWDEIVLDNMPKGLDVTYDTVDLDFSVNTESWTAKINHALTQIKNNIEGNIQLTADDITYIRSLPHNGLTILNYFALGKIPSAKFKLEDYAKYIAAVNAKEQMNLILDFAQESLNQYISEIKLITNMKQEQKEYYNVILKNVEKAKNDLLNDPNIKEITTLQKNVEDFIETTIPNRRKEQLEK